MKLKSIKVDYGNFLAENKKTFHFQFPRLTVFIGTNDSHFNFLFSIIRDAIPAWDSTLEIENENGEVELIHNKLYRNALFNQDFENETLGRLFLQNLTDCDLDIPSREKLGKYLNSSKNQIIIATHCPLMLNWLSDKVAKESIFFVYDKPDELGGVEIIATRFFDNPDMAEKLSVMGPGEVLVDTDLIAFEKQLVEGYWSK